MDKFCCKTMENAIKVSGPGFVIPLGVDMRNGRQFTLGPTYKKSNRDRGIMLNFCPWCQKELSKKPVYLDADKEQDWDPYPAEGYPSKC